MTTLLRDPREIDDFLRVVGRLAPQGAAWKSRQTHNGCEWVGYVLVGVYFIPERQVSFFIPARYWPGLDYVPVLESAPLLDLTNAARARERLHDLLAATD